MYASLLLTVAATVAGQEPPALKIQSAGDVRHPSSVRAVAITPDSRTAFVGINDGTLLAYNLETRKGTPVGKRTHGTINDVAVNRQGTRVAVTIDDGNIAIYDAETMRLVTKKNFRFDPERIVFHPDGETFYVTMGNGHLMKMRTSDMSTIHDVFPSQGSRVLALSCSPDGNIVATTDRDGQIKFWSTEILEHLKTVKASEFTVRALAFEADGKRLISGGADGTLKVWDVADHTVIKEIKEVHQLSVECITLLRDGGFVTGGFDGLCQFWNKDYEAEKSYPTYRGVITAGAASPDGRWLVRGGSALDFVPLSDPAKFERVGEYGGAILSVAVSADLKQFVSGGLDRRLIQWNASGEITSRGIQVEDWISSVNFSRNDRAVAVGLANGKIELRTAGTLTRENSWQAHKGRVTGIAAVGDNLVSIGEDGLVHLWNPNGNKLKSMDEKSPCRSLAVRGDRIAVGASSGVVSVYDANGELVKRLRGRPMSVTALCFSGGGTRLMVGYFDGGFESFDVETWNVVHFLPGQGSSVLSVSANMKSDWVAVGYRDGNVRIVDVKNLKEGGKVRSRGGREVFAVRWAQNEHTVIAAGASNDIAFYRLQSGNGGAGAVVLNVQDRLTITSNPDLVRRDSYAKAFTARLEQGRMYVIDLMSSEMDTYLRIEDSRGNKLAEDDDGGEGLNSRLTFTPQQSGDYRLIATTFTPKTTGGFTLRAVQR
jgi:WD40 repeat protein